MNAELINKSLELVAERCEDPTPIVYRYLFAKYPDVERLFIIDRDSAVRGHMLFQVIECIMDYIDKRHFAESFILSELHNHHGIGVPPDVFSEFFFVVADAFREIGGNDWTPEIDAAWRDLANEMSALISEHYRISTTAVA